jgi:hemerythrin-like domain-containing protein
MSHLLKLLVAEHERILAVIAGLRDFATLHAAEEPDARGALAGFVRFLRDYVDGWHHGKEEDLLFDVLVRAGMPRDVGPIGCMLGEHVRGRQHVQTLAALTSDSLPFSPGELRLLDEASAGYQRVLVPHIGKENQVLYPMAARLLPRELLHALDSLAVDFAERRGAHVGVELEALGKELVDRYAAARMAAASER